MISNCISDYNIIIYIYISCISITILTIQYASICWNLEAKSRSSMTGRSPCGSNVRLGGWERGVGWPRVALTRLSTSEGYEGMKLLCIWQEKSQGTWILWSSIQFQLTSADLISTPVVWWSNVEHNAVLRCVLGDVVDQGFAVCSLPLVPCGCNGNLATSPELTWKGIVPKWRVMVSEVFPEYEETIRFAWIWFVPEANI